MSLVNPRRRTLRCTEAAPLSPRTVLPADWTPRRWSFVPRALYAGLCLLVLVALSGCGGSAPSETKTIQVDPPVRKAEPEDPSRPPTESELHRLLREKNPGYDGSAEVFQRDGQIVGVMLRGPSIVDITPLANLHLEELMLAETRVEDLSPLAGMPLARLTVFNAPVRDLSPLAGMPLKSLDLMGLPVEDLSPLRGMALERLMLDETKVKDLSPLRGMPLLELWLNHAPVADIALLEGMGLQKLNLFGTKVRDIRPVATLPLNTLWLRDTPVEDFRPLKSLFLESLDVEGTAFGNDDLKLLSEMPLKRLNIARTKVTDLRPLAGLELTRLIFTPEKIEHGLDVVRNMPTLQQLDTFFDPNVRPAMTPAEFWRRFDAASGRDPLPPDNGPAGVFRPGR